MTDAANPPRYLSMLSKVYFFALIPFLGAAVAPWILGPDAPIDIRLFLIWSFTVNVALVAVVFGLLLPRSKAVYVHAFIVCTLIAGSVAILAASILSQSLFVGVALMSLIHWITWLWVARTSVFSAEIKTLQNRFVWAVLACHMFVLLNLIYALKSHLS